MNRRELFLQGASLALVLAARPALARSDAAWTAAEFHAARKFAELPMGRIAYVERGSGPAAVFLHGYPLNGFQWRGAMARLGADRRCIAPDLLGLGYSEVPAAADLSPVAQSEMVVAFLDRLGIDSADLISNDSATGIAQLIAANHPARVRSMLLTNGDTDTNSPPAEFMPAIELAKKNELQAWFQKQLDDNDFARTRDGLGRAFMHPEKTLTHEVLETYLRPLVSSEVRRQQGQRYAIAMLPNPLPAIAPRLREFDRPVRMLWHRNSDVFPDEWAHWLDKTFPKSQGIRFLDDVSTLFFPEELPDVVAQECRRLWAV
jgi:pimeloyl-ACP methyl ester carboxylesterase